jgi:hypothetical protein
LPPGFLPVAFVFASRAAIVSGLLARLTLRPRLDPRLGPRDLGQPRLAPRQFLGYRHPVLRIRLIRSLGLGHSMTNRVRWRSGSHSSTEGGRRKPVARSILRKLLIKANDRRESLDDSLAVSYARVALPNFYNIAIRIANVAARLAVLGLRLRDELGASAAP